MAFESPTCEQGNVTLSFSFCLSERLVVLFCSLQALTGVGKPMPCLLTVVGGHFELAPLESPVWLCIWCLEEHRLLQRPQPHGAAQTCFASDLGVQTPPSGRVMGTVCRPDQRLGFHPGPTSLWLCYLSKSHSHKET